MKMFEIINESYDGILPTANIEGENVWPANVAGQRVYHCTNKLEQIQKTGGLRPREDQRGLKYFGMYSTKEHPFRAVKGIFVSKEPQKEWGKHCLSFVIEPTDKVVHAYADGGMLLVTNPIPLARITIEN